MRETYRKTRDAVRIYQKQVLKDYQSTDISVYITNIIASIALGLFSGSGAVVFHFLLQKMQLLFEPPYPQTLVSRFIDLPVLLFFIPVLGALVTATMTWLLPEIARQKGVVNVIKSIMLRSGFIPIKVTLFHLLAPIISIGTGVPLGPEGPAAQIGSGMGSWMAQIFRFNAKDMRMYAAAGGGAAIAAVFNAPIAGVFFGIEVILLNDLKNTPLSALIISSVVADIFSRSILGTHHVFSIPHYHIGSIGTYPIYLVLGILCGLVSILYFRLSKSAQAWFAKRPRLQNPFLRIMPLAMVYGIILIYLPQVFGVGYGTINDVLNANFAYHMVLVMFWVKLIFMVLFITAGAYGGTFAPALGLGAMIGFLFALTMNTIFGLQLDPTAFALVAMGGVLSGMNSIPLTSIMLVFEVTNDYRFILPLMFVSIISYLAVLYFNKHSVYTLKLMQEGIDVSGRSETDLLGKVAVRDLKHMDYDVASYKLPFRQLMKLLLESKHGDVFIINDQGRVTGCVSLKEIRQALLDNELVDLLIAGDLAMKVPVVRDTDPVSEAMKKIGKFDIEHIPVVNNERERLIVGSITHQTIIQAYNRLLEEWEKKQFTLNYSYNPESEKEN